MEPVADTSPPSRVNQIEPISPAPVRSAITQPASVVRRQLCVPTKPSSLPPVRS